MAVTVADLRALGTKPVTLRTRSGDVTGHVSQTTIPDAALMIMFASDDSPGGTIVVAVDDIEAIVER